MNCPLCKHHGSPFYENVFFLCAECGGIYRHKSFYPNPAEEKARYETHNNDVNDERYHQFVAPLVSAVLQDFAPHDTGLDFGAGTGPVISKLLQDKNYNIVQYDPFFHNHPELLDFKYDYIVCCEVIEHFHSPEKEFRLLRKLLKPNGIIYCMTHIYNQDINFDSWYYKNDPTHVFIYQLKALEWIKINFGFSSVSTNERLIKLCAR